MTLKFKLNEEVYDMVTKAHVRIINSMNNENTNMEHTYLVEKIVNEFGVCPSSWWTAESSLQPRDYSYKHPINTTVNGDKLSPQNGDTTGCGGKRFNVGKLMWSLLPFDTLKGVVRVLMKGAEKYGRGNWQKGMSWLVCWDCLIRHATSWRNGETHDAESGENHLSHVIANAIFLIWYNDNNRGVDDRKDENL